MTYVKYSFYNVIDFTSELQTLINKKPVSKQVTKLTNPNLMEIDLINRTEK